METTQEQPRDIIEEVKAEVLEVAQAIVEVKAEMKEEQEGEWVEIPEATDVMVFAKNPAEMELARDAIADRLKGLIKQQQAQLKIDEENLAHAKSAKLRSSSWHAIVKKTKLKVQYYKKALQAVDAGYYIVPDFPMQLIAVRTTAVEPADTDSYKWRGSVKEQKSETLPLGEGHYVDPRPSVRSVLVEKRDKEGKLIGDEKHYEANQLVPVDLPFRKIRPKIISDLDAAMKLKVFDEIGILPAARRNRDPMLIGAIRMGTGGYNEAKLHFLISWWLPLEAL